MAQEGSEKGLKYEKHMDSLNARRKWICAEKFDPKPLNKSGLSRVELARNKETGTQFPVVYDAATNKFTRTDTYKGYTAGSLEILINEIT